MAIILMARVMAMVKKQVWGVWVGSACLLEYVILYLFFLPCNHFTMVRLCGHGWVL
jgi:hypothetical protein